MDPYVATLVALLAAMVGQATAAGLTLECYLRPAQPAAARRIWFAFASGALLLALHHGYTLELALRTGIYDLSQAVIAAFAALLLAGAAWGLRRCTP